MLQIIIHPLRKHLKLLITSIEVIACSFLNDFSFMRGPDKQKGSTQCQIQPLLFANGSLLMITCEHSLRHHASIYSQMCSGFMALFLRFESNINYVNGRKCIHACPSAETFCPHPHVLLLVGDLSFTWCYVMDQMLNSTAGSIDWVTTSMLPLNKPCVNTGF